MDDNITQKALQNKEFSEQDSEIKLHENKTTI